MMKQKFSVLMVWVVLSCMVLMGCSSKKRVPIDQEIDVLLRLTATDDVAPMKDMLDFASEKVAHIILMVDSGFSLVEKLKNSVMIPADQVVGALFQLAAMDDATPMKDLLGFTSEEDARNALMADGGSDLVKELEKQFTDAGIEFRAGEIEQMKNDIISLLKRTPYTVELTSEEKDKCVVTLKVNGYSMADMSEIAKTTQQAARDALTDSQLAKVQSGDAEARNDFMRTYMMDYMKAVSEMSPMEEATEIIVECEKVTVDISGKKQVCWMPMSLDSFGNDVEAALMQ